MLRRLALRCVMTWTTRRLLWLTHILLHMSTTVSVLRSRLAWARTNFIRLGNDFGKLDGNTTLSSFLSNKKLNCYSSWKTPNYCFWPHCRYTYMYALTWKNIKLKFLIWYFFHIWHCIRYSSVWIWVLLLSTPFTTSLYSIFGIFGRVHESLSTAVNSPFREQKTFLQVNQWKCTGYKNSKSLLIRIVFWAIRQIISLISAS